jgi:hypothetical protein
MKLERLMKRVKNPIIRLSETFPDPTSQAASHHISGAAGRSYTSACLWRSAGIFAIKLLALDGTQTMSWGEAHAQIDHRSGHHRGRRRGVVVHATR